MSGITELFTTISAWYWFAAAVLLIILELMVGASFFVLWLGVSAAVIGVVLLLYPPLAAEYQFLLFTAVAMSCLLYWHIHLKHVTNNSDKPNLNRRSEQYIGRTVTLKEPIVNGRGRIHIDDSFWRVEGPDLPTGTSIKIIGVNGVVLQVVKSD